MMPTTIPGVMPVMGKPNPVTLVAMVVQRKMVFQMPSGLFAIMLKHRHEACGDRNQADDDVDRRIGRQTDAENHDCVSPPQ